MPRDAGQAGGDVSTFEDRQRAAAEKAAERRAYAIGYHGTRIVARWVIFAGAVAAIVLALRSCGGCS